MNSKGTFFFFVPFYSRASLSFPVFLPTALSGPKGPLKGKEKKESSRRGRKIPPFTGRTKQPSPSPLLLPFVAVRMKYSPQSPAGLPPGKERGRRRNIHLQKERWGKRGREKKENQIERKVGGGVVDKKRAREEEDNNKTSA